MKGHLASPAPSRPKFASLPLVFSRRTAFRASLVAALYGATFSAGAATVSLTATDPAGSTSFNAAGRWSNAAAPSSANDYTVAGTFNLRTPASAGNFTFAGNSLTLGDGTNYGTLLYKGTGPATDVITVNNLVANNAQINNGNGGSTYTLTGGLLVNAGGVFFGTSGDGTGTSRTAIISSFIGGAGPVSVTSTLTPNGTAIFNGANTYTGGTTLGPNATLRIATAASLPGLSNGGTPLPVTFGNNSTLSFFVGGPTDLTSADVDRARTSLAFGNGNFFGLDTTNASAGFTYASNLSGNFGFAKTGINTLYLTGSNSYTGGTNLIGGTLNFTGPGNLGSGAIILNGGILQFAAGNTADITTSNTLSLTGGGSIDSNGNNFSFAGNFGGAGFFTKAGLGDLTLLGTSTSGNFFVRQGRLFLSGTVASLTTAATSYSSVGQLGGDNGILTVSGGAKLTVGTDFNISDVSPSVGSMLIADDSAAGTTVTAKALYVGKSGTDSGAVSQTGGTMQSPAAAGDWRIGGGNVLTTDATAVGTYDLSGGSFNTTGNLQPGAYGVGQMTISGNASATVGSYPSIGRFVGSKGTLNVLGGTFTQTGTSQFMVVGESGLGTLNISGTGLVNVAGGSTLRVGYVSGTAAPGSGVVNLGTGGTIQAKSVSTSATATGLFNFHGGTLAPTVASTTFMTGLTNAYVYSEGGTINTNGFDTTVSQPLLAPAANGVLTIPVTSGGAGYVASPIITISGAGLGASAIPVLAGGVLTGVTVTNPGAGYTATPTVTMVGGNPTTAAVLGTPTVGNPTSGALRKTGTGKLTLSGTNTYAGGTAVNGGTLAVGAAGALGTAGNLSLASGTTLDVSTLGAGGYTLDAGRTLTSAAATITGLLNVSGTYQSTGASALNGGLTVNGGGLVAATGGTLTIQGTVTNNGTIRASSGATIAAGGASSFVNNGVIDLIDGSAQFPAGFSNGANGVVLTASDVRVTAVSKTGSGVNVQINGLTGFSYQLQRSATLVNSSYANVGSPQTGSTGSALTFTDPAPPAGQAFYRIILSR